MGRKFTQKNTANKATIVAEVSQRVGKPKTTVEPCVSTAFEALIDLLLERKRVEVRNFGTFTIQKKAGRNFIHPGTGQETWKGDSFKIKFSPSPSIKQKVDTFSKSIAD